MEFGALMFFNTILPTLDRWAELIRRVR